MAHDPPPFGHPVVAALDVALVSRDQLVRERVGGVLRGRGHAVRELRDANALLAGAVCDLVVLDLGRRLAEGLEACQQLRAREPWADATVLALCAEPVPHEARAIWQAGADDVCAWCGHQDLLDLRIAVLEQLAELKRSRRRAVVQAESARAIQDGLGDAVLVINDRGIVTDANAAAARLFGYEREDLIGGTLQRLMPPHLREPHTGGLRRYLSTGRRGLPSWTGVALRGLRRDGAEIPLELSLGEAEVEGHKVFTGVVRPALRVVR
jgi:PAS domain S-box-containing protein